tara:strand:+ start:145 stop:318 length:174 start_codon:yes stop_codon:yes gene_type:complete
MSFGKIAMIFIVGAFLVYFFSGGSNKKGVISDNYGQYDKGTALCDKGAYGDTAGLCK